MKGKQNSILIGFEVLTVGSVNFIYKPYFCFNHMVMLSFDLLITVH
jgi:hypothetical protein